MDVSQFQGQSVNMTPAEATAYRKAQVVKNAPIAQAKMNNAFRAAASVTPVGMAINAIEGATRLGMDVPELIKDPSLSTAGAVGMDLLMASPFIPAAASKTGQVISKVDDALMNAPRAQMTLNSGVNPGMMVNAYQDARNAVKGIGNRFSKSTATATDDLIRDYNYAIDMQNQGLIKGVPDNPQQFEAWLSSKYNNKPIYRVVDVDPNLPLKQQYAQAENYGTSIAPKNVINRGRRSGGHDELLQGTNSDVLYTAPDPSWIGPRYGGKNPFYVKMFADQAPKGRVQQINELMKGSKSNTNFVRQYPGFHPDKVPSGALFEDKVLSVGGNQITPIIGRKGDKIRDAVKVVSGSDFEKLVNKKFNHGGSSHDPPQESAEGQKDWMMNYIQSPMYLKRLSKEFPDYSNEQLEAEKNARLSNVKNVNIKYPDKPLQDYFGNVSGEYFSKKQKPDSFDRNIGTGKLTKPNYPSNKKGNLYLEPEYRQDNWNPDEGFNTIPLHELGHAADDGGYRIPYKTEKLIYDSTNKAYEGLGAKYDVPVESYAQSVVSDMPFYYKNNPTEFVNRLTPLRYELERAGIWKPGEEDFIDGMYNIMLKNPDVMKNKHIQDVLDQIPGADDSRSKRATVTKLLNEIALNDVEQDLNVAKHGGSHFLENNTGLEATQLEDKPIDKDAMTAMMKSKFATALAFGNPAAKRMVNAPGKDANLDDYIYTGDEYDANWGVDVGQEPGTKGSHYMAGFGNKAVPFIQERNGKLDFISDPHVINPETRELARDESGNIISNTDEFFYFDNPKDAKYFSEHYKEIAPDSSYRDDGGTVLNLTDEMIHEYKTGGYTVEYLD